VWRLPHPAQDELGGVPKVTRAITLRVHRGHDCLLGLVLTFGSEMCCGDTSQRLPRGSERIKGKAQRLLFYPCLYTDCRQLLQKAARIR
jgi:hypothetical protein